MNFDCVPYMKASTVKPLVGSTTVYGKGVQVELGEHKGGRQAGVIQLCKMSNSTPSLSVDSTALVTYYYNSTVAHRELFALFQS